MPRPRRRPRWVQPFDTKRVITRFGVVQMPREVDPSLISVELLLTDPYFLLVPRDELPEATRRLVDNMTLDPLPNLNPEPILTPPQMCMLQIIAELEEHGSWVWSDAFYHYATIRGVSQAVANNAGMYVGRALERRGLITEDDDPPMLTLRGHARLRAEELAEYWRARLGLREYPLERVERYPDTAYDEIYFVKDERLCCYLRCECFEVNENAKVVVLAHIEPELYAD